MFRFLFGKPTVKNWCNRLRRDSIPEKMMKCLIPDMLIFDKLAVLDAFLEASFQKTCSKMIIKSSKWRRKRREGKEGVRESQYAMFQIPTAGWRICQGCPAYTLCAFGNVAFDEKKKNRKKRKEKNVRKKMDTFSHRSRYQSSLDRPERYMLRGDPSPMQSLALPNKEEKAVNECKSQPNEHEQKLARLKDDYGTHRQHIWRFGLYDCISKNVCDFDEGRDIAFARR